MKKNLTLKQEKIFTLLKDSIRKDGYPPTVREIGEQFHITVKGAYDHLKAIEKKGYIHCNQNKSRAIELLVDRGEIQSPDTVAIPLLGRIAAGSPILAEENIEDHLHFPRAMFKSGELFALAVKGDSMIDAGINDGDIAIIKKQKTANSGEIVAALIESEATLKIFKREKDRISLVPANPAYKPIKSDSLEVLGKLVGLFRRY
jgi:repressor LexA